MPFIVVNGIIYLIHRKWSRDSLLSRPNLSDLFSHCARFNRSIANAGLSHRNWLWFRRSRILSSLCRKSCNCCLIRRKWLRDLLSVRPKSMLFLHFSWCLREFVLSKSVLFLWNAWFCRKSRNFFVNLSSMIAWFASAAYNF